MDQYGMGIGQALRLHRERQRLSLDTISRATAIRRDYLELIDADELHRLPAGAYAKGFIRAYASCLCIDPAPLVKAYEERLGGSVPELSAAVRHPVRVPNAVRPRTWRMAAGAGMTVLVLLGLLGALRPGDETAEPPQPSPGDMLALTSGTLPDERSSFEETVASLGTVVRVEAIDAQAWVEAETDGTRAFAGVVPQGETKVFRGTESVALVIDNAPAVRLFVNGRELGTPTQNVYRATITNDTRELAPPTPSPMTPRTIR